MSHDGRGALIGGAPDGPVARKLRELQAAAGKADWYRLQPVVDDVLEPEVCPHCKGRGARVLPGSCAETECDPCEGTGEVQDR